MTTSYESRLTERVHGLDGPTYSFRCSVVEKNARHKKTRQKVGFFNQMIGYKTPRPLLAAIRIRKALSLIKPSASFWL